MVGHFRDEVMSSEGCRCFVQVSPEGLGSGDSRDISPMSGTVEFLEGSTTALLTLTVIDDQVCLLLCVTSSAVVCSLWCRQRTSVQQIK